jgi:hypothetical protein
MMAQVIDPDPVYDEPLVSSGAARAAGPSSATETDYGQGQPEGVSTHARE